MKQVTYSLLRSALRYLYLFLIYLYTIYVCCGLGLHVTLPSCAQSLQIKKQTITDSTSKWNCTFFLQSDYVYISFLISSLLEFFGIVIPFIFFIKRTINRVLIIMKKIKVEERHCTLFLLEEHMWKFSYLCCIQLRNNTAVKLKLLESIHKLKNKYAEIQPSKSTK